jgi:hypothetical protein
MTVPDALYFFNARHHTCSIPHTSAALLCCIVALAFTL